MEKSIRSALEQEDICKSEKKGLGDGSQTFLEVYFGVSGDNKMADLRASRFSLTVANIERNKNEYVRKDRSG